MKFLKRLTKSWTNFWFISGPPYALAVFRILFGIYWLTRWLIWLPHVSLYFSEEGMHFPLIDPPTNGVHDIASFFGWVTQPVSPQTAWTYYLLTILCLVVIIIGWQTRPALFLYFLSFIYHYLLYLYRLNAADRLLLIITGVLLFSPCGKVFSVDAFLSQRKGEPVPVTPLWTQRLICIQVCFMYIGTGLFKVTSSAWKNGEILINSLMGNWASPTAFWLIQWDFSRGVYDLAVLLIIVFELYAPIMLFHPKWQWTFFVMGFFFHLSIAILLNIWQFMIMPLTYVLFVDPQVTAHFVQRTLRIQPASSVPQA